MIKYCPTCNRSSKDTHFIGEFCENCVEEKVVKSFPKYAKIIHCKRCGRIRTPTGYQQPSEETMGAVLSKELGKKSTVEVTGFDTETAFAKVTVPVGDDEIKFEAETELKFVHEICQDCYRKSSGYFEAIIQLRGNQKSVEKMKEKIVKFTELRNAFISKIEEVDVGTDIYLSSKLLANAFFSFNKLVPKKSYTLYSIGKDGKEIWRNTYLLRLDEI